MLTEKQRVRAEMSQMLTEKQPIRAEMCQMLMTGPSTPLRSAQGERKSNPFVLRYVRC